MICLRVEVTLGPDGVWHRLSDDLRVAYDADSPIEVVFDGSHPMRCKVLEWSQSLGDAAARTFQLAVQER